MTDLGRSLALAQQLRDHAALVRKMDAFANAGGMVRTHEATARRLEAGAIEIERLASLADKYKWQVRDTCRRAEKAEADLCKLAGAS